MLTCYDPAVFGRLESFFRMRGLQTIGLTWSTDHMCWWSTTTYFRNGRDKRQGATGQRLPGQPAKALAPRLQTRRLGLGEAAKTLKPQLQQLHEGGYAEQNYHGGEEDTEAQTHGHRNQELGLQAGLQHHR